MIAARVLLASCVGGTCAAQAQWQPLADVATETLVSVSTPSNQFEVAVGNNGQIVHYVAGEGAIVPSGTGKNLLDVHAVDATFAVASGQDVRLLWNGEAWSPIYPEWTGEPRFFTPIWAPPEKDRIIYQELNTGLGFHTTCQLDPADPDAAEACLALRSPILTLCGVSRDVKALQVDGSILRFADGTLANPDGGALFDQPANERLNLIAAFIPPQTCFEGNAPPAEIFAINQGSQQNEFWHFNGTEWNKQADAGVGETLTGMTGVLGVRIVAVGREAPAGRGPAQNRGVIWSLVGDVWSRETLPEGLPGLSDVSLAVTYSEEVFRSGFEAEGAKLGRGPDDQLSRALMRARGEPGSTVAIEYSGAVPAASLEVIKELIDPMVEPGVLAEPIDVGDEIVWRVTVTHRGGDTALSQDLTLFDTFNRGLRFIDSPDCEFRQSTVIRLVSAPIGSLSANESASCDLRMEVLDAAVDRSDVFDLRFRVANRAYVSGYISIDLGDGHLCLIEGIGDRGTNYGCF